MKILPGLIKTPSPKWSRVKGKKQPLVSIFFRPALKKHDFWGVRGLGGIGVWGSHVDVDKVDVDKA